MRIWGLLCLILLWGQLFWPSMNKQVYTSLMQTLSTKQQVHSRTWLDMQLIGNLWVTAVLWLKCLEYLKTKVACFWEVLDRQCPLICRKMLNVGLRVCTKDSKFESAGWYCCCLTELVPGGHDLNRDMNLFSLISVPDMSGSTGTCNTEQNLHHRVVRGS